VPLTPGRSIAVDPRAIPLGAPVFLSTTQPGSEKLLQRLVLAQDTGGAIKGAVRADFFWGFGAEAGAQAGRMRQRGEMWALLPRRLSRTTPRSSAPVKARTAPVRRRGRSHRLGAPCCGD
jgi:membrane-bound lytic murein transglycosylase A